MGKCIEQIVTSQCLPQCLMVKKASPKALKPCPDKQGIGLFQGP